ncbi:MAG: hypothetical protein NW207_09065 [Cytophagales bacterium]|nr:hypothetical protein [Cytophagales bacterium]
MLHLTLLYACNNDKDILITNQNKQNIVDTISNKSNTDKVPIVEDSVKSPENTNIGIKRDSSCYVSTKLNSFETISCGNGIIYSYLDETKKHALSVGINVAQLSINKTCKMLEINKTELLVVKLLKAKNSMDSIYFNFCNDVSYPNEAKPTIYNAQSGTVTLYSNIDSVAHYISKRKIYKVTIIIDSIRIVSPDNKFDTLINKLIIKNAPLGWFPG